MERLKMLRLASKRLLGLASRQLPSRPIPILPRVYPDNVVGDCKNPRNVGTGFVGAPTRIFDSCFRAFCSGSAIASSSLGQTCKKTGGKPSSKVSEKRNIRDHKRRLLAARYELRRKLYKALCNDPELPSDMREKHRCKLSKLPRNSSFVRVRNRCIFSGRPRAVYKKFRMSRIVFRGLAAQGSLVGVKKASW